MLGGVPFRSAHEIVGKLVALAAKKQVPLDKLTEADFPGGLAGADGGDRESDLRHAVGPGGAARTGSAITAESGGAAGVLEEEPWHERGRRPRAGGRSTANCCVTRNI